MADLDFSFHMDDGKMQGPYKLEKVIDGKVYKATYYVDGGMVTLHSDDFEGVEKCTQLGGMTHDQLASLLLAEVAQEANR